MKWKLVLTSEKMESVGGLCHLRMRNMFASKQKYAEGLRTQVEVLSQQQSRRDAWEQISKIMINVHSDTAVHKALNQPGIPHQTPQQPGPWSSLES